MTASWPDVKAPVDVNLESARCLLELMKADRQAALASADAWKEKWQNVCHERDDALDANRTLVEALRLTTKDAQAYCADRTEIAGLLEDALEQEARCKCRLEEEGLEP